MKLIEKNKIYHNKDDNEFIRVVDIHIDPVSKFGTMTIENLTTGKMQTGFATEEDLVVDEDMIEIDSENTELIKLLYGK